MITIKNYVRARSVEEAYELNQKKNNIILGGMLWLKMQNKSVDTAIDLSELGLDEIEESETNFTVGAMVTLRQLEQHLALNKMTNYAIKDSINQIVGVQFRNLATIGGSIFGRFGFSDILTAFLALDAKVELFKEGIIPLSEFITKKKNNDILLRIIIEKKSCPMIYMSQRNTKTDFPVITCAVVADEEFYHIAIGARPRVATKISVPKKSIPINSELIEELGFGSNSLASKDYREHLCSVLIERSIEKLKKEVD